MPKRLLLAALWVCLVTVAGPLRAPAQTDTAPDGADTPGTPRFGAELTTKPFLAPAAGVGAVAEQPLRSALTGALILEVSALRTRGPVDDAGEPRALFELSAGLRAEIAWRRVYTGVGIGLQGVLGRWIGGSYRSGSSFSAGAVQTDVFHPFTIPGAAVDLTLSPGIAASFSVGPQGFAFVPDLLPIGRVRLTW